MAPSIMQDLDLSFFLFFRLFPLFMWCALKNNIEESRLLIGLYFFFFSLRFQSVPVKQTAFFFLLLLVLTSPMFFTILFLHLVLARVIFLCPSQFCSLFLMVFLRNCCLSFGILKSFENDNGGTFLVLSFDFLFLLLMSIFYFIGIVCPFLTKTMSWCCDMSFAIIFYVTLSLLLHDLFRWICSFWFTHKFYFHLLTQLRPSICSAIWFRRRKQVVSHFFFVLNIAIFVKRDFL